MLHVLRAIATITQSQTKAHTNPHTQRNFNKLMEKIKKQSDQADVHAAAGVRAAEISALKPIIDKVGVNIWWCLYANEALSAISVQVQVGHTGRRVLCSFHVLHLINSASPLFSCNTQHNTPHAFWWALQSVATSQRCFRWSHFYTCTPTFCSSPTVQDQPRRPR